MSKTIDEAEAAQMKELSEMVRRALAADNVVLISTKWSEEHDLWEQAAFYNHQGESDIPMAHLIRILMQALVQLMIENRNPNVSDGQVMNTMFGIFREIYMEIKQNADRTQDRDIH